MKITRKPIKIFGIKIKDKDVLMKSQSGGAFYAIAKYFFDIGGIVYGCGQNEQNDAIYCRIETLDKINIIQGSKYVQADYNGSVVKTKIQFILNELLSR